MKWLSVLAIAVLCAGCSGSAKSEPTTPAAAASGETGSTASAQPPAEAAALSDDPSRGEAPAKREAPAFRELTIPQGTQLRLELKSAVGSDTSHVEDTVQAVLRQPVRIGGETVLPAGTPLTGAITNVARSGRVKGRAQVAYRFQSLRIGGERYDIRTAPVSHEAKATKGSDAKKIAVGAGAGAAVGALLGGGGGAAKGAAIGGAGGTGVVLATRGKEVHLGPGADVSTRLTAPVTLRIPSH